MEKIKEIPKFSRHGCSLFVAQESADRILVSLSFPVDRVLSLNADEEFIQARIKALSPQFPALQAQLATMAASPALFVVNCRDRFPLHASQPFLFIGDASHAVSPFAGAGANMALIDGHKLGEIAARHGNSYEELRRGFEQTTFEEWKKVVQRQRSTIHMAHATSRWNGFVKCLFVNAIPFLLSPSNKIYRRVLAVALIAGVGVLFASLYAKV